ncbi:hypothetical protein ILYODFUR_035477 [Ilyodon furcidens]|uniref:Uncharacterized protein n=1 Tax=Ilyodon furcidens TaxID=33524 RepID=A0ABV0UF70_9TELE
MGHALVWKQEVLRPLCSPEVGSRRDLHQSSMYYNGQEDKKVFSYKSEYLNILPAEIVLCAFLFVVRIVLVLKTVCRLSCVHDFVVSIQGCGGCLWENVLVAQCQAHLESATCWPG